MIKPLIIAISLIFSNSWGDPGITIETKELVVQEMIWEELYLDNDPDSVNNIQ